MLMGIFPPQPNTYDHTHWATRDPVRSPLDKPVRAKPVVGSVTTSESLVLYVCLFVFVFFLAQEPGLTDLNRRGAPGAGEPGAGFPFAPVSWWVFGQLT